jgi:hypothetical protein
MEQYLRDPRRFVTADQHAVLTEVDLAGALRLPAGPIINPLLHRGLVSRTKSQALWLTPAGRSVLHALNERN